MHWYLYHVGLGMNLSCDPQEALLLPCHWSAKSKVFPSTNRRPLIVLRRRRSARLKHTLSRRRLRQLRSVHHDTNIVAHLCHLELHSSNGLSICDSEVGGEGRVAHDGGQGITVLVREPFAMGICELRQREVLRRYGSIGRTIWSSRHVLGCL